MSDDVSIGSELGPVAGVIQTSEGSKSGVARLIQLVANQTGMRLRKDVSFVFPRSPLLTAPIEGCCIGDAYLFWSCSQQDEECLSEMHRRIDCSYMFGT